MSDSVEYKFRFTKLITVKGVKKLHVNAMLYAFSNSIFVTSFSAAFSRISLIVLNAHKRATVLLAMLFSVLSFTSYLIFFGLLRLTCSRATIRILEMDRDNPPDPPGSPPYPLPGTSVMLLPLKLASENAIQAQFPLILMDTVLSSKLTFLRLCADL